MRDVAARKFCVWLILKAGRKPGGRLGIVLPEGIFNNPSLAAVRELSEDRAYIRALVSLPQETFSSSGASVKASLLFLQKFTGQEQSRFDSVKQDALLETRDKYAVEIAAETARIDVLVEEAKKKHDANARKTAQKELSDLWKS